MTQTPEDEIAKERFALYGFELKIPGTWRVEFNPKGTRDKGDVVFHSPLRNKIYVSWGPLEEATKRFKSVEQQRDWAITNLRKSRGVKSVSVVEAKEMRVCGHRALITRISASLVGGLTTRKQSDMQVNSAYLHCREGSRYYVISSLLKARDEYSNFPTIFESVALSLTCHGKV